MAEETASGPPDSDPEAVATDADATGNGDSDDAYGSVLGAPLYALLASDSWLFRSYVLIGGALSAFVVASFTLSLVVVTGETVGVGGGTFSFSRSFVVVLMLLVLLPLVAPILAVARRHRRTGSTVGYDRALAATGYAFVFAVYVGLVISAPAELRDPASNPVLVALYDLPALAGLLPPAAAAGLMFLAHRAYARTPDRPDVTSETR